MDKIALDKLNAGSEDDFVRALGDIFEHTPGLARAVYAKRPFASLGALYEAMEGAVRGQSRDEQVRLLQGASRSGRQSRAGRDAHRRLESRAIRAPVSISYRKTNTRASTN